MLCLFDMNVYLCAQRSNEVRALRRWVHEGNHKVVLSGENRWEVLHDPKPKRREQSLRAMLSFGEKWTVFAYPGVGHIELDLLNLLRRRRPDWIKPAAQRRGWGVDPAVHWRLAKHGSGRVRKGSEAFWDGAVDSAREARDLQRMLREVLRDSELQSRPAVVRTRFGLFELRQGERRDADEFWRLNAALDCFNMLQNVEVYNESISPPSDMALRPELGRHLRTAEGERSWLDLWLSDIDAPDEVPSIAAAGLCRHYQLRRPPKVSDAMDAMQSALLPRVDAFVTADQNYASELQEVARHLQGGRVVRLERDVSVVAQLESAFSCLKPKDASSSA